MSGHSTRVETLFASTSLTLVANTTAEKSIVGSGVGAIASSTSLPTLPRDYLSAGKTIRITLRGTSGQSGSGPQGTILIRLKLAEAIVLSSLPGLVNPVQSEFSADAIISCLTAGSKGSIAANGSGFGPVSSAIGIDTTVSLPIDVTVQFDQTGATFIATNIVIEALN